MEVGCFRNNKSLWKELIIVDGILAIGNLQNNINKKISALEQGQPPYLSSNNTWIIWNKDNGEYEDSGVSGVGQNGADGKDAYSPYIGENGNWYIYDDAEQEYVDSGTSSGGGKSIHNQLQGRADMDAHPISSITDLQEILAHAGANIGVLIPPVLLGDPTKTAEEFDTIIYGIDDVIGNLYIDGDKTTDYYPGDMAYVQFSDDAETSFLIGAVSYDYINGQYYTKIYLRDYDVSENPVTISNKQEWWVYGDPQNGGSWQTALTTYFLQQVGYDNIPNFARIFNTWDSHLWVYFNGEWSDTTNPAVAAAWGDSVKSGSVQIDGSGYYYQDVSTDYNKTTVYQKTADIDMSLMVENYPEYNQIHLAQRQLSKYGQILEQLVDISGDYQNVYTKNGGTSYESTVRMSSSPYGAGLNGTSESNNNYNTHWVDYSTVQMPEIPADGGDEAYTPTATVSVRRTAERSETDELSTAYEVVFELTDPSTGEHTTHTLHLDSKGNFTWNGLTVLTEENGFSAEKVSYATQETDNPLFSTNAEAAFDELTGRTNILGVTLSSEEAQRETVDIELSQRISAVEGKGGFLDEYDFGMELPTQEDLTTYAMSQIQSLADPLGIFNGTRVTNAFDNEVWVLTNTQDTEPPVFEWSKAGSFLVSAATNDTAGIIKGDTSDLGNVEIFGVNGEARARGVKAELSNLGDEIEKIKKNGHLYVIGSVAEKDALPVTIEEQEATFYGNAVNIGDCATVAIDATFGDMTAVYRVETKDDDGNVTWSANPYRAYATQKGQPLQVDYYVSVDGSDENEGTDLLPFATITHAADVVRQSGLNGTIHVTAGTYNERGVINDVRCSIVGDGMDATIIDGGIEMNCSDCKISDLTARITTDTTSTTKTTIISIFNASKCMLNNVRFFSDSASVYGVSATRVSSVFCKDLEFSGTSYYVLMTIYYNSICTIESAAVTSSLSVANAAVSVNYNGRVSLIGDMTKSSGVTVTGKKFNVTGAGSVLSGSGMLTIFPTAGATSSGGVAGA